MAELWERPDAVRGIRRQLQDLDAATSAGAELYGWKLGLGAPAVLTTFGIPGPIIGYLLNANVQSSPATVGIAEMFDPKAEPEVAVRFGGRLDGDESDDQIVAAVDSVALAIEVVDITPTTRDLETVLAVDIFQRAVVTGATFQGELPDLTVGSVDVFVGDEPVRHTDEPAAMTGTLVSLLRYTARWLAAVGRRLDAGEVVILGSTVPPVDLRAGDCLTYRRNGFEPIDIVFR